MPHSRTSEILDKCPLQYLREKEGYRSGRAFARHLDISPSTYMRYERFSKGPDSRLPMKAGWLIADALNVSIDAIVGRTSIIDLESSLQYQYDRLSEASKVRLDEYLEYLQYRDARPTEGRY